MQSEQQNEENSNDVREEADLIMEQRMLGWLWVFIFNLVLYQPFLLTK